MIRDRIGILTTTASEGRRAEGRLRAESLASTLNAERLGFPQRAVVCVRRLRHKSGWPDLRGVSRRPALDRSLSDSVESVWFLDEAEMLACLASDLVAGGTDRWWWRSLLRTNPTPQRVAELFLDDPASGRAALDRLRSAGLAEAFRELLPDPHRVRLSSVLGVQATPGAWREHGLATSATGPASSPIPDPTRSLQGSAPSRTEGGHGDAWIPASFLEEAPDAAPSATERIQGHRDPPIPEAAAGVPHSVRSTESDFDEAWIGLDGSPRSEPPSRAASAKEPDSGNFLQEEPGRDEGLTETASRTSPEELPGRARTSTVASPHDSVPVDHPAFDPPRIEDLDPPPGHRPSPGSARAASDMPESVALASGPETVFRTEFGGILFALNAMVALGWYPDFTRPLDSDIGIPPREYLARLGVRRFGRRFLSDPLAVWLGEGLPREVLATEPPDRPILEGRIAQALGARDPRRAMHLLCRIPAAVSVASRKVFATYRLSAHPLEIRMAGLDRDPGWIPGAGFDFRFEFAAEGT